MSTRNRSYKSVKTNENSLDEKDKQIKIHSNLSIFIKNHLKEIIFYFILILATIFYLITLKGCPDSQAVCLKNFNQKHLKYYAIILSLSGILYTFIYLSVLIKKVKYQIAIVTTLIIFFLCFIYDTGTDLKSHGQYNRNFLFILMGISFILEIFVYICYLLIKKSLLVGLIIIKIILILLGLIFYIKLSETCNNWTKGLKGSYLDNTTPGCKIKIPNYCWMNFISFDISNLMGENCEQIRMDDYEILIKWTKMKKERPQIIGLPRTENWKFFPRCSLDEFQFWVLEETHDMEDADVPDEVFSNTEVLFVHNKTPPIIKQRVVRDDELVNNRMKLYNINKESLISKNVIFLFIDSLSRDNFRRKLPLTKMFLENYYKNKDSDTEVFQFFKYHSIASWTSINMIPAFFGTDWKWEGETKYINEYFKEKGFITGQSSNQCGRELYDLEENTNIEKLKFSSFDHENNGLFCNPNYVIPGHPFSMLNGPYGSKRRCLYGKDTNSYVFDYGKKFWKAYKDEPKFLKLGFIDAHEGTGEVVKYMDQNILSFFEFLKEEDSFKDTTIIIMADHGVNMPGLYTFLDAEDFWIEKTLPTLFLLAPRKIADEYGDKLKDKEHVLIHPYDINNTLKHLSGANRESFNKIGESLFNDITNTDKRNCNDFGVVDGYCNCQEI